MNKTEIAFMIWAAFMILLIGGTAVYGALYKPSLLGVGQCVNSTAIEQEFVGSSEEKWNAFAEYCYK